MKPLDSYCKLHIQKFKSCLQKSYTTLFKLKHRMWLHKTDRTQSRVLCMMRIPACVCSNYNYFHERLDSSAYVYGCARAAAAVHSGARCLNDTNIMCVRLWWDLSAAAQLDMYACAPAFMCACVLAYAFTLHSSALTCE